MNYTKNIFIAFLAGLGIGVVSGKVYYEKKYRMKVAGIKFKSDDKKEEESKPKTEEVQKEEVKEAKEFSKINQNKDDLSEMSKKVKEENPRFDYSTPAPNEAKREVDPYIEEDFEIEPEDFGERSEEDYDVIRLLFLADKKLVYENGIEFEPVEEPQRKIGKEAMNILRNGTIDNSVLYVRNNRLKIDYEIIWDDRTSNDGISEEDEE